MMDPTKAGFCSACLDGAWCPWGNSDLSIKDFGLLPEAVSLLSPVLPLSPSSPRCQRDCLRHPLHTLTLEIVIHQPTAFLVCVHSTLQKQKRQGRFFIYFIFFKEAQVAMIGMDK